MAEDKLKWFDKRSELLSFSRALVDSGQLYDKSEVLQYFEEPWSWTPKYRLWKAMGRPNRGGENWDEFTRRVIGEISEEDIEEAKEEVSKKKLEEV